MHLYASFFYLLVFFISVPGMVLAIPLEVKEETRPGSRQDVLIHVQDVSKTELNVDKQSVPVAADKSGTVQRETVIADELFSQQPILGEKTDKKTADDMVAEDYLLFEQDELAEQQEGLGIYETLAPMLSPEAKKEAKKLWENTADFRDAIKVSDVDSETQALVLTKASADMTEYKGKSLDELAGKALPPRLTEAKDPDKEVVHELFVRFYELLKNAFLIIISVLAIAKVSSLLIKKLLSRRKKRRSRRSSHRHVRTHPDITRKPRKRRRRSYT